MNKIDQIYADSAGPVDFSRKYCEYLSELLSNLDHGAVAKIIETLIEANNNGNTIYFIGNGGSAATSSHFACDLGKGTSGRFQPFKARSLVDNLSTLTAYANDFGYDSVFWKQLEILLNKGDVVVSISASGNSVNLINAINYAKSVGATTISLLGFDGGMMKEISDLSLLIQTTGGEYGPVEDMHMILDHLISSYLHRKQ